MKNSPDPDSEFARAKLMKAYAALGPAEKAVLQLLSVLYEPVSRTNVQIALSQAGIQTDDGKPFGKDECRDVLDKLTKNNLVHSVHGSGSRCRSWIAETATRDALRSGQFEQMAQGAEAVNPVEGRWSNYYYYAGDFLHVMRRLRLMVYRGQYDRVSELVNALLQHFPDECRAEHPLITISNNPFDPDWFATLPNELAEEILWHILVDSFHKLTPADEAFAYLDRVCTQDRRKSTPHSYRNLWVKQLVWRGRFTEAAASIGGHNPLPAMIVRTRLALLTGNYDQAVVEYEEALAQLRKVQGKRKAPFPDENTVFYALALLQTRDTARLKQAEEYLAREVRAQYNPYRSACAALLGLVHSYLGTSPDPHQPRLAWYPDASALDWLALGLVAAWSDAGNPKDVFDVLAPLQTRAEAAGYHWWAAEIAMVRARLQPESDLHDALVAQAEEFFAGSGGKPLVDMIRRQEAWERSLDALEHVADDGKPASSEAEHCLIWNIELNETWWRIEPRESKRLSSGQWGKGKIVPFKRLCTQRDQLPYLTPQDIAVCSHIAPEVVRNGYYGARTVYELAPRALLALVGHPRVFTKAGLAVEVVKGDPELLVARHKKYVNIELVPPLRPDQDVAVVQESPTRLKVVECRPEHRRMASILKDGLHVPLAHQARVLEALTRVASLITVHSDIGAGSATEVPADARPHLLLLPSGPGLRVQLLVRPLAEGGAYYRPGAGGKTVLAELDGRPVHARRDLSRESDLATQAVAACPTLERAPEFEGEWTLDDPEECLELLEELHALGDTVLVEWPQGRKMRVDRRAAFTDLQLKVAGGRNWFEATGQLRIDEDRVLDMRQLLELLDETQGRFLPLGDGQFLALTKEFRKRLDEIRAVSDVHGKGLRFHPLAAPAVEGLFDGAGAFRADKAWQEHIERFRAAQAFEPVLPTTLRADLRDYQLEGYQWMARLAHWGAGACLADDMGLGKTVQALTLILAHAADGPALVVAPTSVCMNWIEEAQRFAPTLNPILFGAGDRRAALDALKPFDLLVCSYGLLYQEEEKLTAVRWRVAVLDEAQAIKNVATRRSQAAMNLQAEFRIITTGTPIENHLGELWNLFRFINPGLLGSMEQFTQRFVAPIERRQDRETCNRLKKVIQPFILRRVKEQVLEELPSRTEILLHVEFSPEETAFYEALRRQAVQKIAQTSGPIAKKHLMILAEIMRLRRACCNARLVTPEVNVPSSKLAVFLDLVDELLENRHKALVFSQFVGHLSLLREQLDARGIAYQYLDGSTPPKERRRSVNAFQNGEGDLFLISLKAGGLGLNLTAADYVIHMDPWWNPAVEDQASDRAHRIGQLRPVTIYRLVTKDTIESKIVELHRHKRDLADSLLEGSDLSGKLSAEQLLNLIQDVR